MNMIEEWASTVPYMVCSGNHEESYNFSHYQNRFHMPGDESGSNTNLYSSFNVGPVHFVSISTEMYFYDYYTMDHLRMQYEWLVEDLKLANQERVIRPWIIVYGHRPMYCSPDTNDPPEICTTDTMAVRDGVAKIQNENRQYGLENLLYENNVDIYFAGHMHSYERMYPTYREQVTSTSYINPLAPIHIVGGAAGGQEQLDHFDQNVTPYTWSAFKRDSYGFGMLTFYNNTHLHWSQINAIDGSILDEVMIVQNH